MTTVNVYLTFDGNCREAFEFYQSIFGGAFSAVNKFSEMPPAEGMPPIPEEMKGRLMHISLPISGETVLMGSDTMPGMSPEIVHGNNFSLSVLPENLDRGKSIFAALSEGGTVTMPFEKAFWGAYYGMLVDKYGIQWMVNYPMEQS